MKKLVTQWLIKYLSKEVDNPTPVSGLGYSWRDVIKPGDVLLVEGRSRVSTAIKYLTQSTWSHAALVLDAEAGELIEADMKNGVVKTHIEKYTGYNVRVCRPIDMTSSDTSHLLSFAESHIGISYDLKNIVDLARYLIPTPPIPARFRRQMLTLGSGDPTEKVICSALIARAFQSVGYPMLPMQWLKEDGSVESQARHYSLFMPRDFDLSPYFDIVKPTVVKGFDYQTMVWSNAQSKVPE
jgi:hypothetical protein